MPVASAGSIVDVSSLFDWHGVLMQIIADIISAGAGLYIVYLLYCIAKERYAEFMDELEEDDSV